MKNGALSAAFLSLVCFTAFANAEAPPSQANSNEDAIWCDDVPKSMRLTARHIENKGIGYNTGYTTLETFLAAPPDKWCVMPFLDLRGHLFNNGKWAANGGIGLRNIMGDRVYGIYSYYDYRDARKDSYNQVSFGLETLGVFWDARLNGYVVLGPQKSRSYGRKFDGFSDNHLYYKERFEYALSGANGEIGFHPIKMKNVDVYTAIGPYYLKGPSRGAVWGVETRAMASWKEYIAAEISYSYDHMFSNIVQGQVSFTYPFGPKSKVKPSSGRSCRDNHLLYRRMVQPVMKEEIIPVHTKKQVKKAVNPETGDPYVVWFVDNLSHSNGTFESPFSTLAAAQNASGPNDIIYVYPGDGTATGMNGFTLKDGQQFLSSSTAQQIPTNFGMLVIPAQTRGQPVIGPSSVFLANNNIVSGFFINSQVSNPNPITNLVLKNNTVTDEVILNNLSGRAVLANNNILSPYDTTIGIFNTGIQNAAYFIQKNYLSDGTMNLQFTNCSAITTNITGNRLLSDGSVLVITLDNAASETGHMFNIASNNIYAQDVTDMTLTLSNFAKASVAFNNNMVDNNYNDAWDIILSGNSICNLNMTGNRMRALEYGLNVNASGNASMNINASDNFIGGGDNSAVNISASGNSLVTASVFNNVLAAIDADVFVFNHSSSVPGSLNLASNSLYSDSYENTINVSSSSSGFCLDANNNSCFFGNLAISNSSASDTFRAVINGNKIVDSVVNISNASSGTMCLQFNNNISNPTQFANGSDPYQFSNGGSGIFNLETLFGNQGYIHYSGNPITFVTPGTCSSLSCP